MLVKTRGIVLHAFKYGESSLITEIYTEQLGLRRYVVSGVRSRKPRMAASLFQVLTPLDLVVYHREDRDLNRIKEARPDWVLQQIPFSQSRGPVALFLAELIRKTVRESERNETLFAFLRRSVQVLDRSEQSLGAFPVYVLVQLSSRLGFQPAGAFCEATPFFHLDEGVFAASPRGHKYVLEPEGAEMLSRLLQADWAGFSELDLPREPRRQLFDQLLIYYRLHLGHFHGLNSPDIIRQVMGG
jgi:DNA repair protein RecO (recombination protein O)